MFRPSALKSGLPFELFRRMLADFSIGGRAHKILGGVKYYPQDQGSLSTDGSNVQFIQLTASCGNLHQGSKHLRKRGNTSYESNRDCTSH